MRIRTTTTAVLAVVCLTLAGCISSDDKPRAADTTAPTGSETTPTAEPSTEPSLSEDEIKQQCTDAVAEAAPGWDDWNYSPGSWQDDPRTPAECLPLADEEVPARGNRAFMDALIDGLELADDPRVNQ